MLTKYFIEYSFKTKYFMKQTIFIIKIIKSEGSLFFLNTTSLFVGHVTQPDRLLHRCWEADTFITHPLANMQNLQLTTDEFCVIIGLGCDF